MILQHTSELGNSPKRIVSLVPSQTELLFTLGLHNETAGITKFCVHPAEWFATKTRVGGTKNINLDKIDSINPDLIIANKEENLKEQVEQLAIKYPVWVSDVYDVVSALLMIKDIGVLTGKELQAEELIAQIKGAFSKLPAVNKSIKTAYLIWRKPYMTVGGDTFISDVMQRSGFVNVFAGKKRYPVISAEEIREAGCRLLLLSSEPYPFKQQHIDDLQEHLPDVKIVLVDGEYFSWYGSRMLSTPAYLINLAAGLFR